MIWPLLEISSLKLFSTLVGIDHIIKKLEKSSLRVNRYKVWCFFLSQRNFTTSCAQNTKDSSVTVACDASVKQAFNLSRSLVILPKTILRICVEKEFFVNEKKAENEILKVPYNSVVRPIFTVLQAICQNTTHEFTFHMLKRDRNKHIFNSWPSFSNDHYSILCRFSVFM